MCITLTAIHISRVKRQKKVVKFKYFLLSTLNHCLFLVIYDIAAVNAFKDAEKAAQSTTRWCCKRRFGCVSIQLKGWNCIYVFIGLSMQYNAMHVACKLMCV